MSFKPSSFDIVLMNEMKGIIASVHYQAFTCSLVISDKKLKPGKYFIMISPHHADDALLPEAFKSINVNVIGPYSVQLLIMEH